MKRSVSVVTPLYNHARYLYRAVASAYWQLGPEDQIVVVDDASTDQAGPHLIAPFADRVLWLRHETNRGLSASRNDAIRAATGEWIKFLDADDVLAPFALNAIHHGDELSETVKVLTGGCHRVFNRVYVDFLHGALESLPNILHQNPILPSATFVRRQALLDVGLFDERIDFEEDWDLWLRLHQKFGLEAFAVTDQPFCFYWLEDTERAQAESRRTGQVEGVPVREYFRQRYGAEPW
jgi:glycosyltransferase involved in cell wall biosynthesis